VSSPAFSVLPERVVSGEIGVPCASIGLQPAASSAKIDSCEVSPRNDLRCLSIVSGNALTPNTFPPTHTQRLEREKDTRHGQITPEFHPSARQASVEIGCSGDGSDWFGMGPQRGRVAPPHHDAAHDGAGTHRPLSDAAALIRAARLRDMLAAIEEYRRASGTDRAWWRSHAGHLIREWRRRYPHYWEVAA
jgi:hypothetical protein